MIRNMPRRRSAREDANDRRRKVRQRRKRKFSAIKKFHELHTICGYNVACLIINPETGQAYTYRSADHGLWQPVIENIPRFNLVPENLLPQDVEMLLQRRSSQDGLEDEAVSEDEDKAYKEVEPYQSPSSEPRNEEIQNHNGSVTKQKASSEDGITPAPPPSVRQSSPEETTTTIVFKYARDKLADPQSVIANDRRSTSRELVTASLPGPPSTETIIGRPQTTSTAAVLHVNSITEDEVEPQFHNCVEAPDASATPLMKHTRRPGDRLCRKRCAGLKEEMKRLLRIQRIHEELYKMRAAGEVEESDFESDFFDHEEGGPSNR
ncbi:uncharacterized protein PV07_10511 [Cladophialophora immunda]|uniref:MADS-box domain-containing protein n=1 Tax=Cladophialophora immunda TaxID=569365 RepID=A0A0D1ZAT5_9EURO|nr:uncharacterized protein PV07_10511 [Cladophialophora immunda]KIW24821.1 hypothetical protein PV07_10511 [Cladophialophora immunda]